ncbi:ArsR family transcriptional regulator [Methylomonas sp. UP202]|uniref:ArsR family transcriptional regulator n=1 Tax=Methylomonas sp. UP202 TaxID=3040943 RepID=UPI00247A296D|nr:ArsR family transcriptional regulator [Methylomonas sp. UP202]WGS88023.1 MarR family transcriptional regulator [Methylomonas sp. UP202]
MTLLVHRVGLDDNLQESLRIAWLNEDETSTTLLELLRRIYLALSKRYPGDYRANDLEPIYDLEAEAAERLLATLLLEKLAGKTLLVALENLDALFEGLGKAGQQRLRAFIQEHPVMTIVATAQRLVDDVSKRNSTFFGFFQTEMLAMLSVEEAAELLGKIAALNRQDKAAAFLRSPTGRSRVRALHHLSGGNHRVYLVLSQFITGDNIDALVEPFAKMVDEMTPYYQERIRWLPPQQRKIVEFLCGRERPTPVKDMARHLFASQQTISSQLKDLRAKGYVQSAQRGRESLYEIAEPLMRICVEIKENQSPGPLRLLVDFLRIWYDGVQLDDHLSACGEGSLARGYLQAAIDRNSVLGNLRAQLLVEDFRNELNDEQREEWMALIEDTAEVSEELAVACGELAKGNHELGLQYLAEIGDKNSNYPELIKINSNLWAARVYFKLGDYNSVIRSVNSVVEYTEVPYSVLSSALSLRGKSYAKIGHIEMALDDFNKVIALEKAPPEMVANVLIERAPLLVISGKIEDALSDLKAVIAMKDISSETFAKAYIYIALTDDILGKHQDAISSYSAIMSLPKISFNYIGYVSHLRGLAYLNLHDLEHAEQDFRAATVTKEIPIALIANSYIGLSIILFSKGQWEEGVINLSNGLEFINDIHKPKEKLLEIIISIIFVSNLSPTIRKQRIAELMQVFEQHHASNYLGEALIRHLGSLHRDPDETPSPDNLEQWCSAWEAAGTNSEAMKLPLRLLRTGIDFLKAGAQDRSVLLDLNQEERQILVQTFGLGED